MVFLSVNRSGLLLLIQLAAHDREALVVDRGREAGGVPKARPTGARLVLRAGQVGVGLYGGEAATGEIPADVVDEPLRPALTPRLCRRRDAGDHGRQRRRGQLRIE